jgi:hypothetical protein
MPLYPEHTKIILIRSNLFCSNQDLNMIYPCIFFISFIHMCIQCLGHFSPLPPPPLSPAPHVFYAKDFSFFAELEIESRALQMLGKCSTTKLQPQPQKGLFFHW